MVRWLVAPFPPSEKTTQQNSHPAGLPVEPAATVLEVAMLAGESGGSENGIIDIIPDTHGPAYNE